MVFGFGRKKSKARHKSPIQQLVLHTQGIGRAHSLTDLSERDTEWDRERRLQSGPPQNVPHASAGNIFGSRRKSGESTSSGMSQKRPPRPSQTSTAEIVRDFDQSQRISTISNQRTLNELNDIVETLRTENAGLKEKIVLVESEKRRTSVASLPQEEKKTRKRRSKVKNADSRETLDSHLDFPVDNAASELQKIITDLRLENGKLNANLIKKTSLIEELHHDINKVQDASSDLKRQNLFFSSEIKDLNLLKEKLERDLFAAKHANNQTENANMEQMLELERTVRRLEHDLQVNRVNFDKLAAEKAQSIDQIDHHTIIRGIQASYEEKLKEKDVDILKEKIKTAKAEETNKSLHEDIERLMREKEAVIAQFDSLRQQRSEETSSIAPLVMENEMLKNKNAQLEQRLSSTQREVQNLVHQQNLEREVYSRPVLSNGKSVAMKEMMLTLQDDWKDVVKLIQDVETEKTLTIDSSYNHELQKLKNIALEMQQREFEVQNREAEAFRLFSVATLRESTQRKF